MNRFEIFGDGTGEGVRGAFGQAVEVRHAAKEAAAHVGDPDGEQAVVGVRGAAQRIELFDGGVAGDLLDHVDEGEHHGVAKDLQQHGGGDFGEVGEGQRQLDGRVLDVEHRQLQIDAGNDAHDDDGDVGDGRVFGLVFAEEVQEEKECRQGQADHLDALHAEPFVAVGLVQDAVGVGQEFERDLEPDARQQPLDEIGRDGLEDEALEIELPRDGLRRGGEEDQEGHVFHAELVNAQRQHRRETGGHTWRADIVAGLDQEGHKTHEAGEDDGHQARLDGILRHQADADGERHGEQAGDGAGERVTAQIVEREDGGFLRLLRDEQITRERLLPLWRCGW